MRHFHTVLLPFACVLATVSACSTNDSSGNQSTDGTTPVSATQMTSSAVVTGQVDPSVTGRVQVTLNGKLKPIELAPDESFVVRDVPTGDVTFACDTGDVRGEITVKNVKQGEIIQVLIKREGDAIVIVIVERTASSQPPQEVTGQQGSPLVITASHACYWLEPGHYKRDIVVRGSDVHIFGAAHDSCTLDHFSILDGKLELDGDGITVLDVDLHGQLVIAGKGCKVQDSCTHCYGDACENACGNEDDSDPSAACGASDGGSASGEGDAGTVVPEAGGGGVKTDAGPSSSDGGAPPDAGAPRDAATDAVDGSSGSADANAGG